MNPEQRRLLRQAPELVVVDLADAALAALVLAIALEHASLDMVDDPWIAAPATLLRARRLARRARRLREDLDRYRLAVHDALRVGPDDLTPF